MVLFTEHWYVYKTEFTCAAAATKNLISSGCGPWSSRDYNELWVDNPISRHSADKDIILTWAEATFELIYCRISIT